jgi:hypothetical protein
VKHKFETPDSDSIVKVEYDDIVDELYVTMRKGQKLAYGGVPMSIYREFEKANSAGYYFNTHIRWGSKYLFIGVV